MYQQYPVPVVRRGIKRLLGVGLQDSGGSCEKRRPTAAWICWGTCRIYCEGM